MGFVSFLLQGPSCCWPSCRSLGSAWLGLRSPAGLHHCAASKLPDEKEKYDVEENDVKKALGDFVFTSTLDLVESHTTSRGSAAGDVAEKLRRRGARPPQDSATISGEPPLPLHAQGEEGLRLGEVRARPLAQRVSRRWSHRALRLPGTPFISDKRGA